MEIIKLPNPILREKSEKVNIPLSKENRELMTSLYNYVKENEGKVIGISAVQIGELKRLCAIRYKRDDKSISYQLVNPIIIWHSTDKYALSTGEGCLSVDEHHDNLIMRWNKIRVSAFDCIKNKNIIINASEFDAVVLQHEIDHMNGKLYIDYI